MYRHMKLAAVTIVLLLGTSSAWAGPIEEVAELNAKRAKAFNEGNVDAYVADFADDAVFTPSLATFRIEGKEAIRGYLAGLFRTYPQRQGVGRQVISRVYANDTVVELADNSAKTAMLWAEVEALKRPVN